jgi:tetratricopeptide (TPR) repeat protein
MLGLALGLMTFGAGCAGRTAAWEASVAAREAGRPPRAGAEATPAEVAQLQAQAEAQWARRTDPAAIRQAIALWKRIVEIDPTNYTALVSLTHAHYFLADGYLRDDDDAYLATMDQGVAWGEKALMAASPEFAARMREGEKFEEAIESIGVDGIGALYWYAANLGKWAKKRGFAVLVGNKSKVKAIMERCLKLDPTFFHGAPDRYFGVYYAIASKVAGGDLEKSEAHFKRSLELAPYYLGTRILMAEILAPRKHDRAMFDEQIRIVLEADEDAVPELRPEALVEKKKARELEAKADKLF